jgi:hypothetical protein
VGLPARSRALREVGDLCLLTFVLTFRDDIGTFRGMRSESLYFRATNELRQAVDEYSAGQGITLSASLGRLVERGLEAVANEDSVQRIQTELEQRREELAAARLTLAQAEGQVRVLQERDMKWQVFHKSIEQQLKSAPGGKCKHCHQPMSAFDLVIAKTCAKCGKSVNEPAALPDASGWVALIAGIGILLAVSASQKPGQLPTTVLP